MGTNGPFPRSHLVTVFRVMEAGSVRWCARVHRPQSDKAGLTPGPPSPGLPRWPSGKVCLQCRRPGFNPWVRKIPWRSEWLPTPVFLPGESHGQRSLTDSSSQRVRHNWALRTHAYPSIPQSSLSTAFVVQGEALEFSVWDKRETLSVSLSWTSSLHPLAKADLIKSLALWDELLFYCLLRVFFSPLMPKFNYEICLLKWHFWDSDIYLGRKD